MRKDFFCTCVLLKFDVRSVVFINRITTAVFLFLSIFVFSQDIYVSGGATVFSDSPQKESNKNPSVENTRIEGIVVEGDAIVFSGGNKYSKELKGSSEITSAKVNKKIKALKTQPKKQIARNKEKNRVVHYKSATSFQNGETSSEIFLGMYQAHGKAIFVYQNVKLSKANLETICLSKWNLEFLYQLNNTYRNFNKESLNFSKVFSVRPPPFLNIS